ncbi:MAG: dolichyl-phosphate beta-glucosyltransferase [Dehalococcoidia bacterium]
MPPTVEVVIPVYNEERDLPRCISTLRAFLGQGFPYPWRILVADNGSTDSTLEVAQELARQHPEEVAVIHLPEKGRGRALKRAWLSSDRDILSYMDVDLSTDLSAFPSVVDAIAKEGYHIAIGSRLMPGARVRRSIKREVLSRGYNLLIRLLFWTPFTDAQCGFKAISRQAAQVLLPHIKDNAWFFDSELLITASVRGFRIKEVPVVWVEDPDTRVKVLRTVSQDMAGLLRLRFGGIAKVRPPDTKEGA